MSRRPPQRFGASAASAGIGPVDPSDPGNPLNSPAAGNPPTSAPFYPYYQIPTYANTTSPLFQPHNPYAGNPPPPASGPTVPPVQVIGVPPNTITNPTYGGRGGAPALAGDPNGSGGYFGTTNGFGSIGMNTGGGWSSMYGIGPGSWGYGAFAQSTKNAAPKAS